MRLKKRLERGAEAGLAGGLAVAAVFFLGDVLHLEALSTPTALSTHFFGPGGQVINMPEVAGIAGIVTMGGRVVAYSLIHLLAFAALGMGAALLLHGRSWLGMMVGGALYGATACTAVFLAGRLISGSPFVVEPLSPTALILVNALAGAVMGLVLQVFTVTDGVASASTAGDLSQGVPATVPRTTASNPTMGIRAS